jgi:hypothetical protein
MAKKWDEVKSKKENVLAELKKLGDSPEKKKAIDKLNSIHTWPPDKNTGDQMKKLYEEAVQAIPVLVIKVPKGQKEEILLRAGWKKVDIIVVARDFRGEPMKTHQMFAEFKAPGVADQDLGDKVNGGSVSWKDQWLKPNGTVRLMAVSTGRPDILPEGVISYKLPSSGPMTFEVEQSQKEVEVTASSEDEAAHKVGAKGSAGIDWEILKIGGEVSGEDSNSTKKGTSIKYKVTLPGGALTIKQTH